MIDSTYKTESQYEMPIKSRAETLSIMEGKSVLPRNVIRNMATTMFVASMLANYALAEDSKRAFPTAHTISPLPINSNIISSTEEPFQFANREEVMKFISNKPDVLSLYKSLPILVQNVFGKAKVHLSVFRDYEENWSNLRVEIESSHELEKLFELEKNFFELLEKDNSFIRALDSVTISLG